MGSGDGNPYLGANGAAVPAVLTAQRTYFDFWAPKGVDVSPFFDVLRGPRIPEPGGAGFAAGFDALEPYFDEILLGWLDVAQALAQGQAAAKDARQNNLGFRCRAGYGCDNDRHGGSRGLGGVEVHGAAPAPG